MWLSFSNLNEKRLLFCFHIVVIFCCLCFSFGSIINGTETERLALLDFKAKLIDPLEVMNSWNDTIHVCDWYGVTCRRQNQRVRRLYLHSSQLVGPISPSIGNMSFLRRLDLRNNSLNGELPAEIGRLKRLRILFLSNNSISGAILVNISHCSNLKTLALERNLFFGKIPEELGLLSNLQVLGLSGNNLTSTIPHSIGNLTFLSGLFIANNYLVGNIPESFSKLKKLTVLGIADNQLSGIIFPSILNFSSLYILDLGTNQFYGNLPPNLGTSFPNLQFFSLYKNLFSGSIPPSITNISSLKEIYLNSNNFTGDMPSLEKLEGLFMLNIGGNSLGYGRAGDLNFISSLINATKLRMLVISVNNFGGVLPKTIGNLSTEMVMLFMSDNMIYGSFPIGIGDLIGLQLLQVSNNKLSGNIPKNLGKLQNLQILNLQENKLSGYIPFSLGNLTRLIEVNLSFNNLQGQFPKSISQCQQLLVLDLGANYLNGEIPIEIFELSSLSIAFSVHQNQFSGSLPKQVENLKNLGFLDTSNNNLSGEIPNSVGTLISLERLYMQGNNFQGSIPTSLSLLKGLQYLDLSCNNLSGEIPKYFVNLHLQQLNLSYNDFEGNVPIGGIFNNMSIVSVVGNNRLCGGIPMFKLPTCDIQIQKGKNLQRLVTSILSCFVGLFILSLVVYVLWFRKKHREPSSPQPFSTVPLLDISYHNLFKATSGFSSTNLIGSGNFGSVYKGKLGEGGIFIAIKVLNLQEQGAVKSFTNECEALRNIRHRNLVKVLTVCSSIDNYKNDFKALVYEFMENGSLETWLHPPVETNSEALPRSLSFPHRLNIVVDVAFALDYLHHHCGATIVHCDLKPSNILLDNEMIAKVSDFGLVKFLSQSIINTPITHESSSLGVRGTIGYVPPEYGMGKDVSTCGDVYSFGIILPEKDQQMTSSKKVKIFVIIAKKPYLSN